MQKKGNTSDIGNRTSGRKKAKTVTALIYLTWATGKIVSQNTKTVTALIHQRLATGRIVSQKTNCFNVDTSDIGNRKNCVAKDKL